MKFNIKKKHIIVALSGIGFCSTTIFVSAQELGKDVEKKEKQEIQRVVVTGSNLKRIDSEEPAAVIILKRVDIERSGSGTVVEFLATIPSLTSSFDGSSSNSFAQGAAGAGLRGLGEKNTLVLLNGRRLANYGFAEGIDSTFFDLNSLPLSAIERVEVLRDGASAIYGSDAVAGVINFITRKNYQGLEISSRLASHQAGDGRERNISLTGGFGNLDTDRQNLLLSLDLFRSSPTLDRKHALTKSDDIRRFGGQDNRSTSLYPGSFLRYDEAAFREAMPGCKGEIATDERKDQYCRVDDVANRGGTDKTRVAFAGLYTLKLNDQAEFFSEIGFSRNTTKYDRGFLRINGYNHLIDTDHAAWKETLNGQENGGRLVAFRSVYEAGRQTSEVVSNSGRVLAGVRGEWNNWSYESALGYSQNKIRTSEHGLLIDAITKAFTIGGYDPFKLQNNPADVAALITPYSASATSKMKSWDAKITNESIFSLPAGAVGLAAGVSVIREDAVNTPDPLTIANKIEDVGGTGSIGNRTVKSIYGELSIPVIKDLNAQFAVRHDRYSDFGGTTNPKLAFTYRPLQSLLLRGSATTAFKAPTLPQLYLDPSKAYPGDGLRDTIRCIPLGTVNTANCAYYPELKIVSNPALKPEKSKNYSAGFVLEPFKDYSVGVDYYKISQRDTIAGLDLQYLLDHEFSIPKYGQLIERNPRNPALEAKYPGLKDGRLFRITDPYENVGRTETTGLDVSLKALWSLGAYGRLRVTDDYNVMLTLKQSDVPDTPLQERVGGRYNPKWHNIAAVAWEQGNWRTELKFDTRAGSVDASYVYRANPTTVILPTTTSTDLNLAYTGFNGAIINVGVRNLTDTKPRFSLDNLGFIDSTTGRFVFASVRYTIK